MWNPPAPPVFSVSRITVSGVVVPAAARASAVPSLEALSTTTTSSGTTLPASSDATSRVTMSRRLKVTTTAMIRRGSLLGSGIR